MPDVRLNRTVTESLGLGLPRRRSLVGCSPWGREESDTTERLPFHFLLSCIGEGNGNSLWCSCLENPRDGGAWWAAVYGVTQSWTRLKRLSNSSSSSRGPTEARKVKGSEQQLKVPEGEQAGVHLNLQNGNQGQNFIAARTAKKEETRTSEQKPRRLTWTEHTRRGVGEENTGI